MCIVLGHTFLEILLCVVGLYTGLGHVVPELGVKEEKVFAKTCFSMLLPEVEEYMKQCGGEIFA